MINFPRLMVPWDGTNAATYNYLTTLSTTSVAVSSGVTWLGGTSTDWGTASNWCGGVPTSSTDVTIPSGTTYSPTVSSGAVAKTVTINSGATLNGGTNTLTVSGNFTNNGTFTAATGTVVFNASATISGTVAFNNLTTGVSLNLGTATTVNGTFQLNSGYSLSGTAPIYGASSTLKYNSGGSPGRGLEWSASGAGTIGTTVGYPNNVQVSNNTTLNCNNGSTTTRAIAGNLTIDSGSSLYCDYSGGSCALIVGKNITMLTRYGQKWLFFKENLYNAKKGAVKSLFYLKKRCSSKIFIPMPIRMIPPRISTLKRRREPKASPTYIPVNVNRKLILPMMVTAIQI